MNNVELMNEARQEAGEGGWFVGVSMRILHKNITCTLRSARGKLRAPFGVTAERGAELLANGHSRACERCGQ